MRFFAAIDALPSLESMKFPVFSLLTGNFGLFRDEFAAVCVAERAISALRAERKCRYGGHQCRIMRGGGKYRGGLVDADLCGGVIKQ